MAALNLFNELKEALNDLKTFLDENVGIIKPAIQALAALIPQVNDLINRLIGLINDLKREIQDLDVGVIQNIDKVSTFTGGVTTMLETAKNLLPRQAEAINDVLGIASVVSSLPSLDQVKTEIISLLDAINVHLNTLKSS